MFGHTALRGPVTDWRTFMLHVHHLSNYLASKESTFTGTVKANSVSSLFWEVLCMTPGARRWPLTVHSCQPASALRPVSEPGPHSASQARAKNKLYFINIRRTVCHSQRWALRFANTQMAEHWPRDFATSSSFSWERLMSIMENPRRAS